MEEKREGWEIEIFLSENDREVPCFFIDRAGHRTGYLAQERWEKIGKDLLERAGQAVARYGK
ncbi:MAG: hypothetical protein PUC32_06560 [Oscillospiraceae bacterium]|nr:hypothetical protein [Oscillospiraceae bacterium]